MKFDRIVVFGDFHSDLDIMLASMADKGLVRYDSNLDDVITLIAECVNESVAPTLEAMVIPQEQPIRVVFLGDFLDRYNFGYHIIQFLDKIRWENFKIYPIFFLGNHDLLNFHFFINPLKLSDIYLGSGHSKRAVVDYINRMGIKKSLESFRALHADEIIEKQLQFYKTGAFEYQNADYTLRYQYPRDFSFLGECNISCEDYTSCYNQIVTKLGLPQEKLLEKDMINSGDDLGYVLFKLLGEINPDKNHWWNLSHAPGDENRYNWDTTYLNLFFTEIDEKNKKFIPVDWRIISLVWRHHYGHFFRRTHLLHNEGTTVFVHGGISPLAMLDPLLFGNLYDSRYEQFHPLRSEYKRDFSLEKLVNRSNRLLAQLIENALNDYSFRRMNGTEVVDQIGYWRGVASGFPTFGGPIWSDFEYLQSNLKKYEKLQLLYKAFKESTGIERIICGHTHFEILDKPEIRFLKISELENIGLEYLCVDNSCSRGYRHDDPVLNGIEIDQDGKIHEPGKVLSSSW